MYVHAYKALMTKKTDVSNTIRKHINNGFFAVNDPLPPESTLAIQYGVSRHTVRAALESLKQEGLIHTRQGVGSFACPVAEPRYTQSFTSVDDLLQYSQDVVQEVLGQSEIVIDQKRGQQNVGWRPGERWLTVTLLFRSRADGLPVSLAQIYTRPFYFEELAKLIDGQRPLFRLIEKRIGGTSEIVQSIHARMASQEEIDRFGLGPNEPVMEIVRTYFDREGQPYEISVTAHHCRNFRYTTTIRPSKP